MTTIAPAAPTSFVTIFDDTYNQQDCRDYYRMQRALGYASQGHAVPVFLAALDELIRVRGLTNPQIIDFASSYGIVSALMRYEISADAFFEWYQSSELDDLTPDEMTQRDRSWLSNLPERNHNATFIGLDVADRAVAYGQAVGVFDDGFAEDLQENHPTEALSSRLADADLIVECGSVAHLMPVALDRMLDVAATKKPWIVTSPVRGNERQAAFEVLHNHGYEVQTMGLQPFPHRRFETPVEQARAIDIAKAA
ncbi:MAG: hypothetical protein AAF678_03450, partial [Pseudomonadota bacterium]